MNTIHEQFIDQLHAHGFTGEISNDQSDCAEHATDESIFSITPELVIYPKNVSDVQLAVNIADKYSTPQTPIHLTARAAGTGLSGGSLNNSVIINTTRHCNQIHSVTLYDNEHDAYILIETDPGVMYRDLEMVMDPHTMYIPSLPASKDICTIGGMVGNNAAGPDTFSYGHTAAYVTSMDVVLSDGNIYTIRPLSWKEFQHEMKRDDLLGVIYRHVWGLLLHDEESILHARPKTAKNSAGYALWDVISTTVEEFMKGRGVFDLTQVITGSQGTLGIITKLTVKAVPKTNDSHLLTIPIFDLDTVGDIIKTMTEKKPVSIELFDGPTYQAALDNPEFFKNRIDAKIYKKTISYLPWIYRKRLKKQLPHFILLVTMNSKETSDINQEVVSLNEQFNVTAWHAQKTLEQDMLWAVRRASYSLSKLVDINKRPAAFLEDMTVEPHQIGPFFSAIEQLFAQYKVQAYVHGHGGNGHLHFYPLLDFTDPKTADLIPKMAEDFFNAATGLGGNICGEHNDGIIRTPYLDKMFDPHTLEIFRQLEHVCDPHDIFNPGKKVNPRFTIRKNIRHTN